MDPTAFSFSTVIDKKITISATAESVLGTEDFTATVSVIRNGTELVPTSYQNVRSYCTYAAAFEIYLQNVKAGDLVTLRFTGTESGKTYDIAHTLEGDPAASSETSSSPSSTTDSSSESSETAAETSAENPSDSATTTSADAPPADTPQGDAAETDAESGDAAVEVGGTTTTGTSDAISSTPPLCANSVTGAWTNGSCTATALTLAADGGSDPLDDLTGHCTVGDSTCTSVGGGWAYVSPGWHICDPGPCERWENIKFETVEGNGDGTYADKRYHVFAAREESTEALKPFAERKSGSHYSLPDDNAREILHTFTQALNPGAYKFAVDLWCQMIAEDGANHGACDGPDTGSYTQTGSPMIVRIDCTAYADGSTGTLFKTTLPPYPQKTRFEREFTLAKTCNSFNLKLYGYNDTDTFENLYSDASRTTNGPRRTTSDFRSYFIDNLSISPLAIGNSPQLDETAKGLADYFRIVSKCYSTSGVGCEKVFYKTDGARYQGSGVIDIYNTDNDIYLVPGASPALVRKQPASSVSSRTFHETGHQPSPSIDREPISDRGYFFVSKRPEEVAPWTVPNQAMVDAAKSGVSLYQTSDDDTIRTWISLRNPTVNEVNPSFDIPTGWTLYAVVQLPHATNPVDAFPAFEIFPNHLVKCSVTGSSESTQTVRCNTPGDWPLPAQSSRSYIVQIPPLGLASGSTQNKTVSLSGSSESVSFTITGLTAAPDDSRVVMWNLNPYAIRDSAATFADWKLHHVTDGLLYENGLCTMGFCDTFDEIAADQDLDGDGIKSTVSYLPLKKVTTCGTTEVSTGSDCTNGATPVDTCVPADQTVSYLSSSFQGLLSAAKTQGITLGVAMGYAGPAHAYNFWSWGFQGKDTNGDGYIDTPTEYKKAQFVQKGKVDLDRNYAYDWNAVVFDGAQVSETGDSIAAYAEQFHVGDYVAWKTDFGAGGPLARVKQVALDTSANTLTLYFDIPFPTIPTHAVGSLYKMYRAGLLNVGIQVATRSGGVCETLRGHADGEPLREINFPRAPAISWTLNSDTTITSSCTAYDGSSDCKLNPRPTNAQTALLNEVISDYTSVLESTFGDNASNHIVQFASSYDETWGFANLNLNFFGGLGQSELVGVTDLFERAGLRTANPNRGPYFAMERSYRDFDNAVEGMSFAGLTGVPPTSSAYAAELLEYYRDPVHGPSADNNQALIYSGGYGTLLALDQRYKIGLARLKAAASVDADQAAGILIWGYLLENYALKSNDPAYIKGDETDFASATARYVAERDFLAWGTEGYLGRHGVWRAPLSTAHTTNIIDTALLSSGSETVEWSGVLEGYHLFRVAKALEASSAVPVDALPWQAREDVHFSFCALETAVSTAQSLSSETDIEKALSCLCEDYIDDNSCATTAQ